MSEKHELKCWPEYYEELIAGRKSFEIRLNDRDYKMGDTLHLREWDRAKEAYTGRECRRQVTYITEWGQKDGYVVMALSALLAGERKPEIQRPDLKAAAKVCEEIMEDHKRQERALPSHGDRAAEWQRQHAELNQALGAAECLKAITSLAPPAPAEAVQWRTIESAPKGKKVLLAYQNKLGNWRRVLGQYWLPETLVSDHTDSGYADAGWYEATEAYDELAPLDCEPMLWQPLPALPLPARQQEGK